MRAELEYIATAPDVSWHHYVRREEQFEYGWHFHTEIELTLITRGRGTRIVGDTIESYRPGDLTLIGADVPHTYVSTPDIRGHEAVVIQFRRDFLGDQLLDRPEFAGVARLLDTGAVAFDASPEFDRRLRELDHQRPAERTIALLALLVSLSHDTSARVLTVSGIRSTLSQPARQRVDAVCAYLQSHYADPVRLDDVAAVAHMSPAALSRFLKRALGRTMTDYLTELRVAAACQLLSDTDLPIAEIATRCGYDNLSNFNRRFRALKQTNPRDYRRVVTGTPAPPAGE